MKPLSQKILLILLSGLALSFAYTSRQYWRAVKIAGKEWKNINKKEVQDEIRKIKQLGFYELQKSAFIFPYNCKDEIDFIIEFYRLRKYARFAVLESIDNEKHLKQIFSLL